MSEISLALLPEAIYVALAILWFLGMAPQG